VPVAGNPAGTDGKCGTPSTMTAVPSASVLPSDIPWCLTVAVIAWNGQYVPVAGNPAGSDGKCSPAPTYNGLPYGPVQPSVPLLSSIALNSSTPPDSVTSSTPAVVSLVGLSSSTPQAPAVPPASSSPLPAPPVDLLINVASSQHPYCKRKLGLLTASAAPPMSSAPDALSAAPSSTSIAKLSSVSFPDFTFVSGTPAAKRMVGADDGQRRRWFGLW
jgi:hypothetical protein